MSGSVRANMAIGMVNLLLGALTWKQQIELYYMSLWAAALSFTVGTWLLVTEERPS